MRPDGGHTRERPLAADPERGEVRSRSARRRAQRERAAARAAALGYAPITRVSLYTKADIRDAVEGEVREQRQQLAARRNRLPAELVTDEERRAVAKYAPTGWAFDHAAERANNETE